MVALAWITLLTSTKILQNLLIFSVMYTYRIILYFNMRNIGMKYDLFIGSF